MISINNGTAAGGILSPTDSVSSTGRPERRNALTLFDPSALIESSRFDLPAMGTPLRRAAVLALTDRDAARQIAECERELGATDQNVVGQVKDFINNGVLPSGPDKVFDRIIELDVADTEQTCESRRHTVLQACKEWLEAAKGPGLNLLHVAGRTGVIVALATVARQVVAHYVEQALREGESTEAARSWGVAAMVLLDLGALLFGALQNERKGTGTVASRISRVCMAGATMGAFIAAYLTGASERLFPAMTGGLMYTFSRGLGNLLIPFQDNSGTANVKNTVVTASFYALLQFVLEELKGVIPAIGPIGAGAIAAMLNAFGMVVDDYVGMIFKRVLPSIGPDLIFPEPKPAWEVRATVQRPTLEDVTRAVGDIGALRGCAGKTFILAIAAFAALLNSAEVDEGDQGHFLSGVVALMAFIIYFPLVFGSARPSGNSFTLPAIEFP
ncbi:hypothetical protein NTD84_17275 [Pseudomonas sp. 14P_8.1_Bac3]|uniref:hypothetical protein n=1 Tax=Pseudomonas sp. 14P_8.1_Bac3 TaxID=2971621 RepID=UPI0021C9EC8E|nr:hypothetical protein [Pseudomonas sp. 14P_8.1_Bac3]MCU1761457.1 hypothetical protein [Pseudomonas sp. 14P_8.1_Bac3]